MRRARVAWLLLALAHGPALSPVLAPALAATADYPPAEIDAARGAIAEYQRRNQKLHDVGWQLVRGNAAYCTRTTAAIGLQLQDLASFGAPDFVRAALHMQGDFAVQTSARGSPAARSGAFTANREIARIDSVDPNQWEAGERLHWQRIDRAHDWIDNALEAKGAITFTFADGTATTLAPVRVCATRFELVSDQKVARANGTRVFLGTDSPAFAYDEPVFAAIVAHELAHNLLRHRVWLDQHKRTQKNVRRAEREADRLIPWLLANAGYDPAAGVTFMQTWGPRHDGGLLRARTHDGWDERADFIAAELPRIKALMAQHGTADWSQHFARDAVIASDPEMARAD
jgi:hypothetical protein